MKTKNVVTQEYKSVSVEKTIWVADDGQEFYSEKSCLQHEEKLAAIATGEQHVEEFNIVAGNSPESVLIQIFFDIDTIQSGRIFKTKATSDPAVVKILLNYFAAIDVEWRKNLADFEEGETILLCSWDEDPKGEYESSQVEWDSNCDIIGLTEAKKKIAEFVSQFDNEIAK